MTKEPQPLLILWWVVALLGYESTSLMLLCKSIWRKLTFMAPAKKWYSYGVGIELLVCSGYFVFKLPIAWLNLKHTDFL